MGTPPKVRRSTGGRAEAGDGQPSRAEAESEEVRGSRRDASEGSDADRRSVRRRGGQPSRSRSSRGRPRAQEANRRVPRIGWRSEASDGDVATRRRADAGCSCAAERGECRGRARWPSRDPSGEPSKALCSLNEAAAVALRGAIVPRIAKHASPARRERAFGQGDSSPRSERPTRPHRWGRKPRAVVVEPLGAPATAAHAGSSEPEAASAVQHPRGSRCTSAWPGEQGERGTVARVLRRPSADGRSERCVNAGSHPGTRIGDGGRFDAGLRTPDASSRPGGW
jgi:hypothetical protein